jgi:hypothetical protein
VSPVDASRSIVAEYALNSFQNRIVFTRYRQFYLRKIEIAKQGMWHELWKGCLRSLGRPCRSVKVPFSSKASVESGKDAEKY